MSQLIDFYFDFYSPYGYFASYKIDEIAARHGRTVNWHPILLGPAFKAVGSKPLLEIPLIGEYSAHDFKRTARLEGVPFIMPPTFPGATLAAARAFYWANEIDSEKAKILAKAFYKAAFAEGRDLFDLKVVAEVTTQIGFNADEMLAAIQTDAIKNKLKQAVQDSLDKGVFGSPFIIIDGEKFWGNDRLTQVDQWLATGGW